MDLITLLKNADTQILWRYFMDRAKAKDTAVGEISKLVGSIILAVAVFDSFTGNNLQAFGVQLHNFLIGMGVSSLIYGFFSQKKFFQKLVTYDDHKTPLKIDIFLRSIISEIGGEGAFMFKYHNGDTFGAYPYGKFTMIRYYDTHGYKTNPESYYSLPTKFYIEQYRKTFEQGFAFLEIEKAEPDFKFILEKEGVKGLLLIPITAPLSTDHEGLIGIKFINEIPHFDHETIDWLVDKAKQATGLMHLVEVKAQD